MPRSEPAHLSRRAASLGRGAERVRAHLYAARMSLETSMTELMDRLAGWSKFPKYQLERRVDIFLTPFLAPYLGHRLAGDPAAATLVAPEFPLLASLVRETPLPYHHPEWTAHTVNADYLVHLARPGRAPSWVLVELKTDASSYRDRQDELYWNAIALGMPELREHLRLVRKHTEARHRPKYDVLEAALAGFDATPTETVELAYLGPAASRASTPDYVSSAAPGDPRRDRVHFLSLAAFAREPDGWVPEEHRALWAHVRGLLARITADDAEPDAR